jgi:hypothetical protein
MAEKKKPFNPFYPLLVAVGIAFSITACAYGVMTVKMLQPAGAEEVRQADAGLLPFLDRYGMSLLLSELGALAVLTFAAIGTDDFWTRRAEGKDPGDRRQGKGRPEDMLWQVECEEMQSGWTRKYRLLQGTASLSFDDVLILLDTDAAFRNFFLRMLADAPFAAYRWETPALTQQTLGRPFEFVLLDSPGLDRAVEREAFAEHFARAGSATVVTFGNLGRDAILIAPVPQGPDKHYGHLAAFVRHASLAQKHDLWQAVAKALRQRISDQPVWLSTAGAGVSWLHVRLDDRPKYYGHRPYQATHRP